MKYVYAALLLHASDKEINEENINKIITSTGETVDEARVKALVASLAEINIDEAIKVSPGIAIAPISQTQPSVLEKEEEEEEEEKEEEAIAGLGALFG